MANKPTNEKLVIDDIRHRVTFSIVESYKNIRTNILTLLEKKDAKILQFSSPDASEGKSTTSLNIAITISQLGKKVLIIDADIHRPSLHKKLKIDNKRGLWDVIAENADVKDIVHTHNSFLDVLTCNNSSVKSSELLNSEKFGSLLTELRDLYDVIIIDSPPINPVSDALVISQKVDAVVLIVRAFSTTYDAFRKAVKSLEILEVDIDGVIINGADPRPKGYYKSKYSYYKSGKTYY